MDATHIGRIALLVKEAEDYRDEMSEDRVRAIEYYDGIMSDTPADEGRSQVVSRDVRAVVKKALPSVLRTIMGSETVVEYQPLGEGDENQAEQATEYVNHIVMAEAGAYDAIHDAVHDALRLRNGILKWWYEVKTEVRVSKHSGLSEDAFVALVNEPDVEVVEHTERMEMVTGQETPVHDLKLRRRITQRRPRVAAVPPEEFLIHPEALSIPEGPIVGQLCRMRRSDLVAMGYDADIVAGLPAAGKEEQEADARRPDAVRDGAAAEPDPSLEEVDYYELYVRSDVDGDGIAELRRVCFGGKIAENCLLMEEEADEVQFCGVYAERKPHAWEGVSIADDVMEIQRIKTVLLRQTLDNIYWQNNPQPVIDEYAIVDMDAVMKPQFGLPIRIKQGADARSAYSINQVPLVAKDSFGMLEYLDQEIIDRTGVSDASAGLPPDALQNVTAKASALMEQTGIGQTEQIVRMVAESLKPMFKGLLKLLIKHQDQPRTVRLRDEWITYDPRHWNAGMDCTVNTGLGAGTRERDMAMMQLIIGLQEKLLAAFGPDNPFVKPENLYAAIDKMVQAAGLRTTRAFFTEPNPEEIAEKMAASAQQPSPEMEKVKMQAEAKQMEMQAKAAADQQSAVLDEKRMAAEFALKEKQMVAEFALKQRQMDAEMQLRREQMDREMQLKRETAAATASMQASAGSGISQTRMGGDVG